MPDNNLRIGATVDKGELEAGFTSVQDLTQKVTQKLAVSFEEASSRSRTAMRGLSDDVKVAAENISDETLRIAEATRVQSAAYADLARARILAKDVKIAPEISTPILGAAQEQVIKASQELATAKQAEANAVVAAAEREALAGEKVTAEALRTAAAVRQQSAAQAELARVQALVASGEFQAAEADQLLAAAQLRAVAASKEVSEAKRAEAVAVARAAEEEALSQNVVIRAFQRMAMSARESMGSVQEKMVETAEASRLEADGIGASFAGLSSLLGAGLAVGFAAHFLDETNKMQIGLEHLATQTAIDVTSLAGLQQMTRQMAGEWEPVERGLVRLLKAQQLAKEGGRDHANEQVKAFERIGISFQELQSLKPDELLNRVSGAIAGMKESSVNAASAITLLGRGGAAAIPLFKKYGDGLSEAMAKTGALTGVTKESAKGALEWQDATAKLAAEFRGPLIRAMVFLPEVAKGVEGALEAIVASIASIAGVAAATIATAIRSIAGGAKVMYDLATGDFSAIRADIEATKQKITSDWAEVGDKLRFEWAKVRRDFAEPLRVAEVEAPDSENLLGEGGGNGGKGEKGAQHLALQRDEDELNQVKLDHRVTLEEEIRFWEQKLSIAKKGSQEYRDIVSKLAPLKQREDRAKQPELEPQNPTETGEFKRYLQELEQEQAEETRLAEQGHKQQIEIARLTLDEKVHIAQEATRDKIQDAQDAVRAGTISVQQELRIERQAADEQYQIELQTIRRKENLDRDDVVAYQRDLNKELELTRQHARQIELINRQAADQSTQMWKKGFQQIQQDLNQTMLSFLTEAKKPSQAFAQMFNEILRQLAEFVLQWIEKKVELWAMDKILTLTGLAATHTQQAASNVATVTGDAGVAAANTMAYYTAIDPPIAPAMASLAFAETIAYAPVASFNEGGMVTAGGGMHIPILAKAGERVLTPSQTENFHSLVNSNSSRGGNTVHQHLHYEPSINAYDRSGFRNQLRGHADDLKDVMRSVLRPEAFA